MKNSSSNSCSIEHLPPNNINSIVESTQESVHKLQHISPYLIDASLRETAVGSTVGQTLAQKIEIFRKLREFGFERIIVGALNYQYPDVLQVDDDFMLYLKTNEIDGTGCFCLTDIGTLKDDVFSPSPSQIKMVEYGVSNTLHEIYLSSDHQGLDAKHIVETLKASIAWLRENVTSSKNYKKEILINIVDGCEAFSQNLPVVVEVLRHLAVLDIDGVSIEDDRGTHYPFQIEGYIKIARSILPSHMNLLVHFHASSGMENAATLSALLHGANGAWGGLSKSGGVSGHASLAELLGNLLRIKNIHIKKYKVDSLIPTVREIEALSSIWETSAPIYGKNSYALNLTYFEQSNDRYMDLPPSSVGSTYEYKVCPVMSDAKVIANRLKSCTTIDQSLLTPHVLKMMICIMRGTLREGKLIDYNQPEELLGLVNRALNHNICK